MSDRRLDDDLPLEAFSALVDGEADAAEVARACASWRDDVRARAHWNAYHLIGDVMRSDELAESASSARFLKSFRERLVQEPVVLAPAGLSARHPSSVVDLGVAPMPAAEPLRRRVWAGPMAVAACFVMVVGALVNGQGGLPSGSGIPASALAQGGFALAGGARAFAPSSGMLDNGVTAASLAAGASFPSTDVADANAAGAAVWRDPQLEQALSTTHGRSPAEQSFASHGAAVRNVLYQAP